MSARLFVALDLPAPVLDALVAWRGSVLPDMRDVRPVDPAALHATLCFLGERPESAIGPLGELVEASASPVGGLALGAPLWLPRRQPRVLAVALEDPHGELAALQARLMAALSENGWQEPEARPFLPHVTVARVRGDRRVAPDPLEGPPALVFAGAALTLYRSHVGGVGARYEPLARVALA